MAGHGVGLACHRDSSCGPCCSGSGSQGTESPDSSVPSSTFKAGLATSQASACDLGPRSGVAACPACGCCLCCAKATQPPGRLPRMPHFLSLALMASRLAGGPAPAGLLPGRAQGHIQLGLAESILCVDENPFQHKGAFIRQGWHVSV